MLNMTEATDGFPGAAAALFALFPAQSTCCTGTLGSAALAPLIRIPFSARGIHEHSDGRAYESFEGDQQSPTRLVEASYDTIAKVRLRKARAR